MTSVGEILRAERVKQGREIAEIAEELCITQRYLRAIEANDLEGIPGTFFYKSFVKQYASALGVDEKTIRPGLEAVLASAEPEPVPGADPKAALKARTPENPEFGQNAKPPVRPLDPIVEDGNRRYFPDRRIGLSLAGLVAVLLVCSGFYAWWNKAPRSVVASVPVASPLVTAIKSSKPGSTPTVDVTATTRPDGQVVLNLSATEETWLSITSDGKEVFSGILQPSQSKTLTTVDVAKMRVGNAGGLEVRWNGKAIGPIGPRGTVRVVLFSRENFQILEPNQTL